MTRLAGAAPLLLLTVVVSSACPAKRKADAVETAAPAPAPAASAAPAELPASDAVFSAPIAAARVGHGMVVAGLVAAEGVLRVAGLGTGQDSWMVDALTGVAWSPDADLRLQAVDGGLALVWRGILRGKNGVTVVPLGPRGERRGEPFAAGGTLCTTTDGLAWIDPRESQPARVRARRWADPAVRDAVAVAPDRTASLVCGDRAVFALGDGDDDLTSVSFTPGDATPRPTVRAIRDDDFGDDEEREHETYTTSDDLGVVRVGASGSVAMRELPHGGGLTAWRKLKHRLSPEDDIVAVDGVAQATLVVFTHEAADACGGGGATAERVRALRVDRGTGGEALLDLAPASCDVAKGPFWIAAAPGAPVVAWVERGAQVSRGAAPIGALELRAVRPDGATASRIDVRADALVDGGCDDTGCFAAALVRAPDADGTTPGRIVVLRYP